MDIPSLKTYFSPTANFYYLLASVSLPIQLATYILSRLYKIYGAQQTWLGSVRQLSGATLATVQCCLATVIR